MPLFPVRSLEELTDEGLIELRHQIDMALALRQEEDEQSEEEED